MDAITTTAITRETHRIDATYTAQDYVRAAQRIERLCPHECHRAFFPLRVQIAESLRRMAAEPGQESHVAAMNALVVFVYVPLP